MGGTSMVSAPQTDLAGGERPQHDRTQCLLPGAVGAQLPRPAAGIASQAPNGRCPRGTITPVKQQQIFITAAQQVGGRRPGLAADSSITAGAATTSAGVPTAITRPRSRRSPGRPGAASACMLDHGDRQTAVGEAPKIVRQGCLFVRRWAAASSSSSSAQAGWRGRGRCRSGDTRPSGRWSPASSAIRRRPGPRRPGAGSRHRPIEGLRPSPPPKLFARRRPRDAGNRAPSGARPWSAAIGSSRARSIVTLPSSAANRPVIRFKVVLPEPLGPMIPVMRPVGRTISTPSTAATPPSKRLANPWHQGYHQRRVEGGYWQARAAANHPASRRQNDHRQQGDAVNRQVIHIDPFQNGRY